MSTRFVIGILINGGACCATLLPHTAFLDTYKAIRARYQLNQEELPVTRKQQEMLQQVMEDLQLPEKERKRIKIFNVYWYDMFHAGAIQFKKGGVIGIPQNYEYEHVDTVDRLNIFLDDKPIDWSKKAAKNFINALVLSENAKKFGIAREIFKLQTNDPLTRTMYASLHITISYIIYEIIFNKLRLKERPRWLHYSVLSACVIASMGIFIGMLDFLNCQSDKDVDTQLSQLGPDYVQGGREFYEKLIQRNIALRSLLGEGGRYMYAMSGNENNMLRQQTVPITQRKNFFEFKLREFQQLV